MSIAIGIWKGSHRPDVPGASWQADAWYALDQGGVELRSRLHAYVNMVDDVVQAGRSGMVLLASDGQSALALELLHAAGFLAWTTPIDEGVVSRGPSRSIRETTPRLVHEWCARDDIRYTFKATPYTFKAT